MSLIVLWEDELQRGTKPVAFGPHFLLAASLADRVATDDDWYIKFRELRLRRVDSQPCGGIDKLVAKIADEKLYAQGHHILAVYDDDRIRERLQLPADRSRVSQDEVIKELSRRARPGTRLTPLPIGHNLEALIETLASPAVGGMCTAAELETVARKASRGQAHLQRDLIFQRHSGLENRALRARLAEVSAEWHAIVEAALSVVRDGG